MNRMTVDALRLAVEWDELSGEVTVGCGLPGRESRWRVVESLREAVLGVTGGFEDLAMMERLRSGGGGCLGVLGTGEVLIWRVRFLDPRESRWVALAVEAAAGDHARALEE